MTRSKPSLFVKDRSFYKTVLFLALPMTMQNVMQLLLNMMDTVMLGFIESSSAEVTTEKIISAAGLANQPYFVYSLFLFGMVSGASVLIAQYWGKSNTDAINSVAGIASVAVLAVGGLFTAVCYVFTEEIMSLFTPDKTVVALGVDYLHIVLASYLIASVTMILYGILRTTEQVKIALINNTIAILINILLNYILIFGKLGFPVMGIRGAAAATLIARIIELLMTLIYVIFFETRVRLSPVRMLRIPTTLLKDFVRYCTPVIANETLWGLGITIHSVIIGNLGPIAHSAYSVANIIERIGLLAAIGFANATLIVIGKEIGAGRKENAFPYAKTMLAISVMLGTFMSAVVLAVREYAINIFNISDDTKSAAMNIVLVMTVIILTKSFNTTAIVGVIRGGGDTVAAMLCDFLPMWLFALPLGAAAAYFFELPVWWVYACLMTDEILRFIFCFIRIRSGKWIKDVTR